VVTERGERVTERRGDREREWERERVTESKIEREDQ